MTPDNYTIQETFLEVGNGHAVYIHDWGNKKAKMPIVFLHGGPGGGCKDRHKQGFDPKLQRVIFFDQRGSGKSIPYGSLLHNTTQDLIEDTEKIINHLKLDKVVLTGTSWGSTLALAYAIKYPKRVLSMILGGIFTGSSAEISWLNNGEFQAFYPDAWDRFLETVPTEYRKIPAEYHYKRALGNNSEAAKQSAYAAQNLEVSIMRLDDRMTQESYDDFDPTATFIEMHYLKNDCFIPDNYLLNHAHMLHMPVYLVQGRYDIVCPPKTAYALSKQLKHCQLIWAISGHNTEHENWNIMRTLLLQLTGGN